MIVNFGAFVYDPGKMANIIGWDETEITGLMKDKTSQFRKLYDKGRDTADYVLDLKLFELARTGDLDALEEFENRRDERN